MKSYSYAQMLVNGKETAKLDIYREHNTFSVFEHDMNVFSGSWGETVSFIDAWKAKWGNLAKCLEETGAEVKFEQTIG